VGFKREVTQVIEVFTRIFPGKGPPCHRPYRVPKAAIAPAPPPLHQPSVAASTIFRDAPLAADVPWFFKP
jgi:hypothetical protein